MWNRLKILLAVSVVLVAAIGLLSPTLSIVLVLLTLWGVLFIAAFMLYVLRDEVSPEA